MDQPAYANITNRFLRALPSAVFRRVQPSLQPITLHHGTIIGHIGAPPTDLYFLDRGLISLVKVMNDGRTAEVGVVGTEGIIAITSLMGMSEADSIEMTVQIDSSGHRLPLGVLKSEMSRSKEVQSLAIRYLQLTMSRLAQAAACNVLHRLGQRCSRWLLVAHDNAGARSFRLTHEFLAMMMGVHRPRLSVVLESLQRRGLIETKRGSITILDRPALEASACECYRVVQRDIEDLYRPM
jgi:CRP-like cAMP-binding protein